MTCHLRFSTVTLYQCSEHYRLESILNFRHCLPVSLLVLFSLEKNLFSRSILLSIASPSSPHIQQVDPESPGSITDIIKFLQGSHYIQPSGPPHILQVQLPAVLPSCCFMNGVPLPYSNLSVDYLKKAERNKAQEKEIHMIVLALSHTTPYFTGLRRCPLVQFIQNKHPFFDRSQHVKSLGYVAWETLGKWRGLGESVV